MVGCIVTVQDRRNMMLKFTKKWTKALDLSSMTIALYADAWKVYKVLTGPEGMGAMKGVKAWTRKTSSGTAFKIVFNLREDAVVTFFTIARRDACGNWVCDSEKSSIEDFDGLKHSVGFLNTEDGRIIINRGATLKDAALSTNAQMPRIHYIGKSFTDRQGINESDRLCLLDPINHQRLFLPTYYKI